MATRLQLLRPRFKLATFDVTNTLLKFHRSVGVAYSDVGMRYGIECDPERVDSAFKTHWRDMRKMYPNFGKACGMSARAWWSELVRRTFSDAQPLVDREQLRAVSKDLFERYSTGECWKVSPGAQEQLSTLREHNVILGIISNFDERLDSVLDVTGLKEYFQFIIASYVVGLEKPDSRIFDLALKEACDMDIKASDAVHVGDDFSLDYMAAKNAGWSALLFYPWEKKASDKHFPDARDVIHDMRDISQHVFYSS